MLLISKLNKRLTIPFHRSFYFEQSGNTKKDTELKKRIVNRNTKMIGTGSGNIYRVTVNRERDYNVKIRIIDYDIGAIRKMFKEF